MSHHEPVNPTQSERRALSELQRLIVSHYPDAVFTVGPGGDEPGGIYLTAIVDLEDPDEVMDLVIDRLLDFQIDEGLSIQVVPIRTPRRVAEAQRRASRPHLPASFSSIQPSP